MTSFVSNGSISGLRRHSAQVYHAVPLLVFDLTYEILIHYCSLVFLIVHLFRKHPIVLPFRIDSYRPVYKPAFSPEVKP